jgi:4-alpha-glucanotransferase
MADDFYPRSSGVQLHPTSLPGGRLGPDAYAFVDWLADAGQTYWQMLPLGPPDSEQSPYKSESAFACWPALLAAPRARVTRAAELDFLDRHAVWARGWEAFAGDGAIADQVRFEREWTALREHAAARGIRMIGDVPIYVAPGSADHLEHPQLFQAGAVAGTPPDAFTDEGQLWGNPLYDWRAMRAEGYEWWIHRLRRVLSLFEVVRIDHFRGFVSYWSVPVGARSAKEGGWRRGPGRPVFDAAIAALGWPLPIIAEDLGVITPAVNKLRKELDLPGMVVLQFGFENATTVHNPANHTIDRVAYTGTHDNDTLLGWYSSLDAKLRGRADRALQAAGLQAGGPDVHWSLIELTLRTPAQVAMMQAQDVLGLGSQARMNTPGQGKGQWRWRLAEGALTPDLARRLRDLTERTNRLPA